MRSNISFAALLALLTASAWMAPMALGQNPDYDFTIPTVAGPTNCWYEITPARTKC